MHYNKYRVFYICSVVLLIFIDFQSKIYVRSMLKNYDGYVYYITQNISFVYSWNHGISFGFFEEYHYKSNEIFKAFNCVVFLYLCFLLCRAQYFIISIGYLFVIGGAIGNLVDRFINGAVFDFISIKIIDCYFPVFNLADIWISCGAFIIIIFECLLYKKINAK